DTQWNTDTGATSCMTPHRHWIRDMTPCCIPVRIATDEVVYALGKGSVLFQPVVGGMKLCPVLFSRVLVPDINNNLFAVALGSASPLYLYRTRYIRFTM
ncbi:hypothetical protein M407DRAFT_75659, partial [Tulasnella calospora MUT 4182]